MQSKELYFFKNAIFSVVRVSSWNDNVILIIINKIETTMNFWKFQIKTGTIYVIVTKMNVQNVLT